MIAPTLPEKLRMGVTWRRIRNALHSPSLLWRNARFWWNDGVSSEQHIFVVGPPRSGTTLVKRIIESHSTVCGVGGETWFFLRRNYTDFRPPGVPAETMRHLIQGSESVVELFDRFADTVKQQADATQFLEKSPEHALRIKWIIEHFPNSTIVFVARDPRDGLRSAREHPAIWSTFPEEDRLGGYLAVWERSVQAYLHHADHKSVLMVRYEDLCHETRKTVQTLMKSCDIGMEKQQLDPDVYGDTETSVSETHVRLKEPITTESIGKWRQALQKNEVARVERTLAHEMRALNYPLSTTE